MGQFLPELHFDPRFRYVRAMEEMPILFSDESVTLDRKRNRIVESREAVSATKVDGQPAVRPFEEFHAVALRTGRERFERRFLPLDLVNIA